MRKIARSFLLAGGVLSATGPFGGGAARPLTKTAQYAPPSASRSWYLDGSQPINVAAMLERNAERYALSPDSRHYLFEAIRANTIDAANENGDCFERPEMFRFDRKAAGPVYKTYIGKPHHLNHVTNIEHDAVGLILDAHYNESAPALASCPQCNLRTAERTNRDESGLHCKRCNRLVKDEFIEILLGIDAHKNPDYARGVQAGHLRSGSMGCTCLFTTCNVCRHRATTKAEFCPHIRSAKSTLWLRNAGGGWSKTNPNEVARELEKRGHRFIPTDFTSTRFDDGFEVRKAFEACGDVTFDEYSRVQQPADPKAQQTEVLRMQPRTAQRLASSRAADVRPDADVRIQAPPNEPVIIEPPDDGSGVSNMLDAPPEGAPPAPDAPPGGAPPAPGAPAFGVPPGAPPPGPPGLGTPGRTPAQNGRPRPGASPDRISPAEMGIAVPGASAPSASENRMTTANAKPTAKPSAPLPPRAAAPAVRWPSYVGWKVSLEKDAASLQTAAGVEVARIASVARSDQEKLAFGRQITDALLSQGLVETVRQFNANLRVASIVDGAVDDMEGFEDKELHGSTSDARETDMAEPRDEVPGSLDEERATDMAEPRDETPTSVTEDAIPDHEVSGTPPSELTGTEHPDNQEGRSKAPKTLLEEAISDHEIRTAAARGEYDGPAPSGTPIVLRHVGHPEISWEISKVIRNAARQVTAVVVRNAEHGARKLTTADLEHWLTEGGTPRAAAREAGHDVGAKLEARLRAYYEAREAKRASEHEAALEAERAAGDARIASYQRALRLVARRLAVGLEPAPLQMAMVASLTSTRQVGVDPASQAPITYQGLSEQMSRYLASEAYEIGNVEHTEYLISRAAALVQSSPEFLLDAERDAANFRSAQVVVTPGDAQLPDAVGLAAAEARAAALRSNMTITPPPAYVPDGGTSKHAAIAAAVSNTHGANLLARFRPS